MNDESFWIKTFRDYLAQQTESDPAHDPSHIERVVLNTRHLAEAEELALDVLLPAAYLHDCVHIAKNSPDRNRASTIAADHAVKFLREVYYPEMHLDSIHHAIRAHSFSAGIPCETREAKILQDADRLDALGAVGLGRCLMLGGHFGSALYHPDDPFCETRTPEDAQYCIDHFYAKLLTLPDTMQTETGRHLASERADFLQVYLDQLRSEIEVA
ncbi:MAG: HD domain-containing protein [Akkermansiaceae bacterium]